MKIRRIVLISILILFSKMSFSENDSILIWQEEIKISWLDFKGVPLNSIVEAANICTSISITVQWVNEIPKYDIYAYMNLYKSWTREPNSKLLLRHEQLHFDITELYARKIRKKVQELINSDELKKENYESEINFLILEYHRLSDEYDVDTSHGLIEEKQNKWDKEIHKTLNELEAYF